MPTLDLPIAYSKGKPTETRHEQTRRSVRGKLPVPEGAIGDAADTQAAAQYLSSKIRQLPRASRASRKNMRLKIEPGMTEPLRDVSPVKLAVSPRPALAKITPPKLKQPVMRERLFTKLDASASATWIYGPPGCGKTTLVRSYLQHEELTPLWYHVDADDSEPSTFFHFLYEAKTVLGADRISLPSVGVETRADWHGFARRFARALEAALPSKTSLVFDNVHHGGETLCQILAIMAGEMLEPNRLIFISHHTPPPPFLTAIANQRLFVLPPESLRFDRDETAELAKVMNFGEDADVLQIHDATNGLAAGIVLLSSQRSAAAKTAAPAELPASLTDYVSHNILNWLPAQTRHVLERCAFFPDFDAGLAIEASGDPLGGELIVDLHRNGFFVEQRGTGAHPSYALHSLLAGALRDRLGRARSPERLAAEREAGLQLVGNGRLEAGIKLLLAAQAYSIVAPHIMAVAKQMVASGREELLANWIAMLPATLVAEQPWLAYWRAIATASFDEFKARTAFEEVYQLFKCRNDRMGMLLSSAAILMSIESGWQSFEGVEAWARIIDENWSATLDFPDAESKFKALLGMLVAIDLAGLPRDSGVLFDLLVGLLTETDNPNLRLQSEMVLRQLIKLRQFDRGLYLITFIDREVDLINANPSLIARWLYSASTFEIWAGTLLPRKTLLSRAAIRRKTARSLADRFGLISTSIAVAHAEAYAAMRSRDTSAAKRALDEVEDFLSPVMWRQLALHNSRHCRLNLMLDRPAQALKFAREALLFTRKASTPNASSGFYYMQVGVCLMRLDQFEEAEESIRNAVDRSIAGSLRTYQQLLQFCVALAALKRDSADAGQKVAEFLLGLQEWQMFDYNGSMQIHVSFLCAEALRRNIEIARVRELIKRRQLSPPTDAPKDWPWPVRINALGTFEMYLWDEPLKFDGKSQKKPIEMLKFLIARTDAQNLDKGTRIEEVISELWPSADAKDPKGSFDVNVHRLRKLLVIDNALVINDGRIRLNRECVWCDAAAFELVAANAIQGERDGIAGALALYRGRLFGREEEVAWAFAACERISVRFTFLVQRQGEYLEEAQAFSEAIAIYEKGLAQDNLVEPFYRGLMRCHVANGQPAEAMRVYRRCRELLSIVLGLKPAPETELLRQKIPNRR